MFYSNNDKGKRDIVIGVLSQEIKLLDTLKIKSFEGEIAGHNAFPVDENNSVYFQTTKECLKLTGTIKKLSVVFEAKYDF